MKQAWVTTAMGYISESGMVISDSVLKIGKKL